MTNKSLISSLYLLWLMNYSILKLGRNFSNTLARQWLRGSSFKIGRRDGLVDSCRARRPNLSKFSVVIFKPCRKCGLGSLKNTPSERNHFILTEQISLAWINWLSWKNVHSYYLFTDQFVSVKIIKMCYN